MTKFQEGDLVWAKFPGYPPWPAKVKSFDKIPQLLKLQKSPNEIPLYYYGSNEYGVLSDSKLQHFKEFYEKYKDNAEVRHAVADALNHENIIEVPLKGGAVDSSDEEKEEEIPSESKKKKEKGRKRSTDSNSEEEAPKKRAYKPRSASKSEEVQAITSRAIESRALPVPSAEKPIEKKEMSKKIKKDPIPRKQPSEESAAPDELKQSIPERPSKQVKKAEEKPKATPETRLRSIRDILVQSLCKANPNNDELKSADKALSLLEKIDLDLELFKVTGIGRLVKTLARKEKLPGEQFKFTQRLRDLMSSWKVKIRSSDAFTKAPNSSNLEEESKNDKTTEESTEKIEEEKIAEKIAEKIVENSAENITEKSAEKSSESFVPEQTIELSENAASHEETTAVAPSAKVDESNESSAKENTPSEKDLTAKKKAPLGRIPKKPKKVEEPQQ